MKNLKIASFVIFILIIFTLIQATGSQTAISAGEEEFILSFTINTEDVNAETMVPVKQFQQEGLILYEIDEKRTIMTWEGKILYIDVDSRQANISGESVQLERKPLKINDDILIPYHLLIKFMENIDLTLEEIEVEKEPAEIQDLELRVIPEKSEISQNQETLDIDIILANNTGQSLEFTFNTGQKYDLKLTDEDDKVVYQWSRGKMFIQAIQHLQLEAGSEKKWQTSIPLEGISPGVYRLNGWLTARDKRLSAETQEITIK